MVTSPMCSRLGVEQVMRDKNRFEERKRGEKGRIEGEGEVKELERRKRRRRIITLQVFFFIHR